MKKITNVINPINGETTEYIYDLLEIYDFHIENRSNQSDAELSPTI
jgi:hypothetical protein